MWAGSVACIKSWTCHIISLVWWHTAETPEFRRWMQENLEFKIILPLIPLFQVSLGYIRSHPPGDYLRSIHPFISWSLSSLLSPSLLSCSHTGLHYRHLIPCRGKSFSLKLATPVHPTCKALIFFFQPCSVACFVCFFPVCAVSSRRHSCQAAGALSPCSGSRPWGGLECEKPREKNDSAFSICKPASLAHHLNFKWALQADRDVR